jgi:hypothetical protein
MAIAQTHTNSPALLQKQIPGQKIFVGNQSTCRAAKAIPAGFAGMEIDLA